MKISKAYFQIFFNYTSIKLFMLMKTIFFISMKSFIEKEKFACTGKNFMNYTALGHLARQGNITLSPKWHAVEPYSLPSFLGNLANILLFSLNPFHELTMQKVMSQIRCCLISLFLVMAKKQTKTTNNWITLDFPKTLCAV